MDTSKSTHTDIECARNSEQSASGLGADGTPRGTRCYRRRQWNRGTGHSTKQNKYNIMARKPPEIATPTGNLKRDKVCVYLVQRRLDKPNSQHINTCRRH